jgi:hypothetical protein
MNFTFASGGIHMPRKDLALLTVAVLLMLVGAAMLVADFGSAGIWIPVIAVGIALTVIVQRRRRR